MKKFHLSIAGLLFLLAIASCGEEKKVKTGEGQDTVKKEVPVEGAVDTTKVPAAVKMANTLAFTITSPCDSLQPDLYCIQGVGYLRFGKEMVFRKLKVEGATIKDTVYSDPAAPDQDWNVKEVRYPDGKVILESDFGKFQFLSRIRIETPRLKNVHGIGVGNTLQDIVNNYTVTLVQPYPENNLLEVFISESNPVVIFQVEAPAGMELKSDDDIPLSRLRGDLKIIRVILWDKTVGNT